MLILVIFAFISGIFTFLAPCIWPILPIIFTSSLKSRYRPFGIVAGVVISFFLLTLGASSVVRLFTFDDKCRCLIASIAIGVIGVIMLIPKLLDRLEVWLSEFSNSLGIKPDNDPSSGFWRGFVTGMALGVVWAPCAGPIIGAVIAISYAGEHTWQTLLITTSYVLGFGIPLLIFAYAGGKLIEKSRILNKHMDRIQQVFGLMLILMAIAVCTGKDKDLSAKILDMVSGYTQLTQKLEGNELVSKEIESLKRKNLNKIPNKTQ
ncbi:MAG: cytochrome c biogenesis CcdA family protein [Candidatus Caenarcaniphilales bacterium]|nr:cytochrome c biogenesis CcdA family protein [Candidatus Caenarcaniphilales bacterium]